MTWHAISIGSLCEKTATTDPQRKPDVPFRYIDISGIDRELKRIAGAAVIRGAEAPSRARQVVQRKDVLVSTVRPNLNAVAMVPDELHGEIASTGFCVLRASDQLLDPRFLYYFTRTKHFVNALLQHVRGANYPAVTDHIVYDVEIPWPAKSEQQRIADVLEQADALQQQRQAADNKALGVLDAVFRRFLGDANSWQADPSAEPLGNLVESSGGGTPSKEQATYWNGDIPWVSPKDMKRDFIGNAEDHITQLAVEETTSKLIPAQSILVVVRGMILARQVPLAVTTAPVAINQDMKALRVIDERVSPLYLFAALKSLASVLHARVGTAGHGTRKLDTEQLLSLKVKIPQATAHERFVRWFEALRIIDAKREVTRARIDALFQTILHRAFTGELTAGWREAHQSQLEIELRSQQEALETARSTKMFRRGGRTASRT